MRGTGGGHCDLPQVRAFILDGPTPGRWRGTDPGFWVAKKVWTKPQMQHHALAPDMVLTPDARTRAAGTVTIRSPLDTGTAAGEWFTSKPDSELPGDQRVDDSGSLVFDSAPLDTEILVLGQPVLTVTLAADMAQANLCARLVDIHPDGTATRVSST